MADEYVKIKKSILEAIVSSVKADLGISNNIKVSNLPTLIRTIPRVVLNNYTNSDNVTNAHLQTLIESVKGDTQSIIEALDFTDDNDSEHIVDEITGGE